MNVCRIEIFYVLFALQMPDVVNAAFEHPLYPTMTDAAASAAAASSSCVSDLIYDESDGSESATPDMDSQLLYVKLKEVCTTITILRPIYGLIMLHILLSFFLLCRSECLARRHCELWSGYGG